MAETSEIKAKDAVETNSMKMVLGANIELLKTDLGIIFSKDGAVNKFLVAPTSVESDNSVTFDEMISDFKAAFGGDSGSGGGNFDNISTSITEFGNSNSKKIDLTKLAVKLNQAFLYIERGGAVNKTEYAVSITLDSTEALPDMGFFRFKSLNLAVWNTNRLSVLKTLNMGSFDALLPA